MIIHLISPQCFLQVPFYVAAQFTGAISASYTLRVLLEPATQIGATSPSGSNIQALVMEMVATFTMVFISTAVATDPKAVKIIPALLKCSIFFPKSI